MRKLLIAFLIIIVMGCASKSVVVVPPTEKYCPPPVRPAILKAESYGAQDFARTNLIFIDYILKLEGTINCLMEK